MFPRKIKEEWSKKDPILKLQKYMVDKNWATESDFKQMRQGILSEVDDATEWALDQPYPDPATVEDNVYDEI